MTALLGIRLNKGDAQCDRQSIYVDRQVIANRPPHLPDADWNTLCRYICNAPPVVDRLTFTEPPPDDPTAWTRLESYMRKGRYEDDMPSRKGKRK